MNIQDNNGLNFNNPEPVSSEVLSDLLGLSFAEVPVSEKIESSDIKDDTKKEKQAELIDKSSEKPEDLSLKVEEKSNEEEEELSGVEKTIEYLHSKGIITDAYEGFDDEEQYDDDTLVKLIEHNFDKRLDEQLMSFVEERSPLTQRILQYDVTSKGKGIDSFIKSLIEEANIKSLNPENEYDQEKIIGEFYKKEGFEQSEIEERIKDFKDNNLLEREAKRLKPKLDAFAEKIAKEKEEQETKARQVEEKVKEDYRKRVVENLKKGEISGIKLNRDEAGTLYSILTNEDFKVTLPNGKVEIMPALEAILYHHRFDQKGSLENVMLAALLLTNREKFDEQYTKKATTEVTKRFIREHTQNNNTKIGQTQTVKPKVEPTGSIPWQLNLK